MTEINITSSNRKAIIKAPVKDSLHASLLADRINNLPYLKVDSRKYTDQVVTVTAYTIPLLFSIDQLHNDLENMSDLIEK